MIENESPNARLAHGELAIAMAAVTKSMAIPVHSCQRWAASFEIWARCAKPWPNEMFSPGTS
jgi:hypothetical protein